MRVRRGFCDPDVAPRGSRCRVAERQADRAAFISLRLHDLVSVEFDTYFEFSRAQKLRLLPALNLTRGEAAEGIRVIESVVKKLAS